MKINMKVNICDMFSYFCVYSWIQDGDQWMINRLMIKEHLDVLLIN